MLPLAPLLVTGGITAVAVMATKRKKKPKLISVLTDQKEVPDSSFLSLQLQKQLQELDIVGQKLVITYIDPLIGSNRFERFADIATNDAALEISDEEKFLNRNLIWSGVTVGMVMVAVAGFPLFYLPTIALAIYITHVPAGRAYRALKEEKRIKLPFINTLNLLGTWLGGYLVLGSLGAMAYFLSEKLVLITQDRSHKKLINIFGQQPRTVWVVMDGVEVEIPFETLQINDQVVVYAGQTIPVDGCIAEGLATIDQHTLTGEAQPIEKEVGDTVFAGTTVLAGRLYIQVEKTGEDTVAAQIGDILNRTTGYQMAIESEGMELAHRLSLPTLVLGLLAWPLVSYQAMIAIFGASTGFNIKITGPIGMLNFLNNTAHEGILIKDGRSLELLAEVDTVVFDKTGTLTLEQPEVVTIHICADLEAATVLRYAAAAEHRQTHPIARAIQEAAIQRNLSLPAIDQARYELGYGLYHR